MLLLIIIFLKGGSVSQGRAKAELAQHLGNHPRHALSTIISLCYYFVFVTIAEDPLPLRKAKITLEAALKRAEKARAPFEAATRAAEEALCEAEAYSSLPLSLFFVNPSLILSISGIW